MTSSVRADRPGGEAAAERLGESHHVGHHAEALRRAPRRDAEARLHLVEDEEDAVPSRQLANGLEVARLGEHDPEVHHAASMITQAGLRPSSIKRSIRASVAPASLNGTGTVICTTDSGIPPP